MSQARKGKEQKKGRQDVEDKFNTGEEISHMSQNPTSKMPS